jgi:hypothetical protein
MRFPYLLILGLFAGITSHAGIIFSTDGTTTPAFDSGGNQATKTTALATPFVASSGGAVSSIIVANSGSGYSFTSTWTLRTDDGGEPGTAIDTFQINLLPSVQLYSGASTASATVTAGQTYWLELMATPSSGCGEFGCFAGWHFTNPNTPGVLLASFSGGAWGTYSVQQVAFAVLSQDAPVPEPSSFVLIGLGACVLTIRRKRR